MRVELYPEDHALHVLDEIDIPPLSLKTFWLQDSLEIQKIEGATVVEKKIVDGKIKLTLSSPGGKVLFHYRGIIYDPIQENSSSGLISSQGVALFGSSYWYPHVEGEQLTFKMAISLPSGWSSISQGQGDKEGSIEYWSENLPQKVIYLMANRFFSYHQNLNQNLNQHSIRASIYLRHPDPDLAQRFIQATKQSLALYSKKIAPYPYSKFALVENFWETGFGMPSFTLLGPRVVQLPFIFTSSYPHEILHNWWGNSVYVDYLAGNWCEGLTSYMADHYFQTLQHQGRNYRKNALKKFTDFITEENDFPLRDFRQKSDGPSEAVGYSKALMFFHMLKLKVGSSTFQDSLRFFYKNYQFKKASYHDIQISFEKISHQNRPIREITHFL
jgi:aminopeptidase N